MEIEEETVVQVGTRGWRRTIGFRGESVGAAIQLSGLGAWTAQRDVANSPEVLRAYVGGQRMVPDSLRDRLSVEAIAGSACLRINPDDAAPRRSGEIIFAHGGGFCALSPWHYLGFLSELTSATGKTALAPFIPLAPEHPYPHAVNAVRDLVEDRCRELGVDNVSLLGDSSGASLAVSVYRNGFAEAFKPARLVLLCPWLDLTLGSVSDAASDAIQSKALLERCAFWYSGGQSRAMPGISPVLARLSGWQSLYIQAAQDDLLLGDAERLTERVGLSGMPVELEVFLGMFHCFQMWPARMPEARAAVRRLAAHL